MNPVNLTAVHHAPRMVTLRTGARLHFGPLSWRPEAGPWCGGVGVMIDRPGVRLTACIADADHVQAPDSADGHAAAQRVREFIQSCRRHTQADRPAPGCRIVLEQAIPGHVGLGSGTQLALAVAAALARLAGEQYVTVHELARRVGRGRRSLIGVCGFGSGGLLIDDGRPVALPAEEPAGHEGRSTAPGPPTEPVPFGDIRPVRRLPLPDDWRFVVLRPRGRAGLHGRKEQAAFDRLPPMPHDLAERLRTIAGEELPRAATAGDVDGFAAALDECGRRVGQFFAPVQGGVFADASMSTLAEWLHRQGIVGVAQSSWGPTIAALCADADSAENLASRAAVTNGGPTLDLWIARPRNEGATARLDPRPEQPAVDCGG